jgi:hypothetical protein
MLEASDAVSGGDSLGTLAASAYCVCKPMHSLAFSGSQSEEVSPAARHVSW